MVSEQGKNLSIRSVMPNLVGKDASFSFLVYLVQKISIFLVFNIPLAAISDLKAKIIIKTYEYYFIRTLVPKSVGNGTSYAPLANLDFNTPLAAILKNGLSKYFSASFGRCIEAYFSSGIILSNQSRN